MITQAGPALGLHIGTSKEHGWAGTAFYSSSDRFPDIASSLNKNGRSYHLGTPAWGDQSLADLRSEVTSSTVFNLVDAGGLKPNTWRRFERLGSAWEQAKLDVGDEPQGVIEAEPGVVTTPRRRTRTPLTDSQVDSIRTARANGESVVSISRRFGVHRMTVWTHTKRP